MIKSARGFTIVELLIVIVVIAILAAISVVAYRGIQERSRYTVMKQDIATINKAIQMYIASNGTIPCGAITPPVTTWVTTANTSQSLAIPGLVPEYLSKMPSIPDDGKGGYYAYICHSNGTDYKLLRLVSTASNLPSIETSDSGSDPNPARAGRGWGIWTSGGANL